MQADALTRGVRPANVRRAGPNPYARTLTAPFRAIANGSVARVVQGQVCAIPITTTIWLSSALDSMNEPAAVFPLAAAHLRTAQFGSVGPADLAPPDHFFGSGIGILRVRRGNLIAAAVAPASAIAACWW